MELCRATVTKELGTGERTEPADLKELGLDRFQPNRELQLPSVVSNIVSGDRTKV